MEPSNQEICFTLTKEDIWYLQLHAYARKRPAQYKAVIFFAAIIVVSALLTKHYLLLPAGALFVVLVFGIAFLSMRRVATKSAQSLRNKGTYSMLLTKEGVRYQNEHSDTFTRWNAVKAIDTDAHTLYFQLDNPGAAFVAVIIPKRAFGDTAAVEQFLQTARSYWQSSVHER